MDDLEEHLRQKRLRWLGDIVRRDEEMEIKKVLELKIEGRRKRGRPVKRWIDVVEEDMRKRGVVQQDTGDWESLVEKSGERTGETPLAGKICQDNKLMVMMLLYIPCQANFLPFKSTLKLIG